MKIIMDMLKQGKIAFGLVYILCLFGCSHDPDSYDKKETLYKRMILNLIGPNEYSNLYTMSNDTLQSWIKSELIQDTFYVLHTNEIKFTTKEIVDSVYCLNSSKNKIIGAVLEFSRGKENSKYNESITEFYGSKIEDRWYFWKGGEMPIGRSYYKNHDPTKPLSYQQLHKAAMENFLGGYLTKSGEINDAWFESKFKSGYTPFEDRYDYEHILDGQKINNEKDYFNYLWKGNGLGNWVTKFSTDSIRKVNQTLKPLHITREQENEIIMYFSRNLINGN